jgi:hypothetical protein
MVNMRVFTCLCHTVASHAESAIRAKSAKEGVTLCNCQLRRGGTEWMIRGATHVTEVAINRAEVRRPLAWRLGAGDCSPSVPWPLFRNRA